MESNCFSKWYRRIFTSKCPEGLLALLPYVNRDLTNRRTTLHQMAYILATIKTETGTFRVDTTEAEYLHSEARVRNYVMPKYAPYTKIGKQLGNIFDEDAYTYRGHGPVQLTGRGNFEKMSKILTVDLVNNPHLALELPYAWDICVRGMMKGVFTGKKLCKYVNDSKRDFYNARRVVNGIDKAGEIENDAVKFTYLLRTCINP